MSVPIVVPARDEAERLPALLADLKRITDRPVIVVDNASRDATAERAGERGVQVITESRVGKGFAVMTGLAAAPPGRVFLCDADISGLRASMLNTIVHLSKRTRAPVVRLALGRDPEAAPVTTLTARPLLSALGHAAGDEPLGGLVLVDRDFALGQHLPGGWGFDVALTLAALADVGKVPEVRVTGVQHRCKPLDDYKVMAEEVVRSILRSQGLIAWGHADCTLCTADEASGSRPGGTEVRATTLADPASPRSARPEEPSIPLERPRVVRAQGGTDGVAPH